MIDRNLIATYRGASKEEIFEWLKTHMPVSRLNPYKNAGFDERDRYRWRMAVHLEDHRVLFDREEDFVQFVLVWS